MGLWLGKRSAGRLWSNVKDYVKKTARLRSDPPQFYFDPETGILYEHKDYKVKVKED